MYIDGMFSTFNYQLFLYETFWKSFIENLFINIIKGKYVYRWDVLNIQLSIIPL